jgi:hypothetical protein
VQEEREMAGLLSGESTTAPSFYLPPGSAAYRYHLLVYRGVGHREAHEAVCREFGVRYHERTPFEWRRRLCARAEREGVLGSASAGRVRYREALRALFGT